METLPTSLSALDDRIGVSEGRPVRQTSLERAGGDVILVSNRVTLPKKGSSAGGLAAALLNAVETGGGAWYGWSGRLQEAGEPATDVTRTPAGRGSIITYDFPAEDFRRFYNGMANSALWPLLHSRADLINFDEECWGSYLRINDLVADRIAPAAGPRSTIWVHDYHHIPLGHALRRRGVRQPIGFFLHTPMPGARMLRNLPHHRTLLRTLLAYDLIGFQTADDRDAFHEYAVRELGATETNGGVAHSGRVTATGVFPVGIDVGKFADAAGRFVRTPPAQRLRTTLRGAKMVIGVDRLDYSKGLRHRLAAYQRVLEENQKRGEVCFLQITPLTREAVDAYKHLRAEIAETAAEINAAFGDFDFMPLRYTNQSYSWRTLAGLYRMSEVGCVTPVRDGMNLVAKEYVAAQDPEAPGVLVLSSFAGAAQELDAALIVNPYDVAGTTRALQRALAMPLAERRERWEAMMGRLTAYGIADWYDSFLAALRASQRASLPLMV